MDGLKTDRAGALRGPSEAGRLLPAGVSVRRPFLPPAEMMRVLRALDALSNSWAPSQEMGLLGRGGTLQVRPGGVVVTSSLDTIRNTLAGPVLHWVRACGFAVPAKPFLAIFPVRMLGDPHTPTYQEPHTDSYAGIPHPPVCTSVFYARVRDMQGGDFAVADLDDAELRSPHFITPSTNALVTIPGERVHWVEPITAGERICVVLNYF